MSRKTPHRYNPRCPGRTDFAYVPHLIEAVLDQKLPPENDVLLSVDNLRLDCISSLWLGELLLNVHLGVGGLKTPEKYYRMVLVLFWNIALSTIVQELGFVLRADFGGLLLYI